MAKDWVTICMCYPEVPGEEPGGEGESSGTCIRELIGGPLDGLLVESNPDDFVWTVPAMAPLQEPIVPFSVTNRWVGHVYARRKGDFTRMYYSGFMSASGLE